MTTLHLTDGERDWLQAILGNYNCEPEDVIYVTNILAALQPLRPAEPSALPPAEVCEANIRELWGLEKPSASKLDIPNVVIAQGQRCFTNHPHREWRGCTGVFGHVKGIEQLAGNAVASDGLLLLIATNAGTEAFVHLENFSEKDKVFNNTPKTKVSVKKDRKPTKHELLLAAMAEEYV